MLSQREQRLFLSAHQCVTLFLTVMVPVFVSTTHQHRGMSFCFLFSTPVLIVQILLVSLSVNRPIPFSRALFLQQNTHPLACDSESETDVWMQEQGLKIT